MKEVFLQLVNFLEKSAQQNGFHCKTRKDGVFCVSIEKKGDRLYNVWLGVGLCEKHINLYAFKNVSDGCRDDIRNNFSVTGKDKKGSHRFRADNIVDSKNFSESIFRYMKLFRDGGTA
ncbi:hypothetical protein LH447_08030 [Laribacter hongkongensis]|uniref:hypothetical protein n=1 Tax=Laribacter hongkongensis TaxID=168471 RepID=UPI001EFCE5BB|nr:hypothetical protein [Laribacter hongkongensis]MCG9053048.1 hypothetical protein [Laribacter hongkongensis]